MYLHQLWKTRWSLFLILLFATSLFFLLRLFLPRYETPRFFRYQFNRQHFSWLYLQLYLNFLPASSWNRNRFCSDNHQLIVQYWLKFSIERALKRIRHTREIHCLSFETNDIRNVGYRRIRLRYHPMSVCFIALEAAISKGMKKRFKDQWICLVRFIVHSLAN